MSNGVKISAGNTKIGKIPNTSLVPIKDCRGSCLGCQTHCYALKAWKQYRTTREAWEHNSRLWHRQPRKAADSVMAWFEQRRTPPKYFRIHVAGDFLNQTHLNQWQRIADRNPGTKFLAFTKRFDLDYRERPSNLIIYFSMWPGMPIPRKYKNLPKNWIQDGTETRIPSHATKCRGNCRVCKACWNNPQDRWNDLH